ncbi:hypothetical protein AYO43_08015 [Nitrospira sp. SCGC AG-212-E16]|nr:hypothetical protein AYO43_08015 [Nitrospira sp. SCGC AG-212-E16]
MRDQVGYRRLQWLIAGTTVLALALVGTSIVLIERYLINVAGDNLALLAETVADKLDQTLFERYGDIQVNSVTIASSMKDPDELRRVLNRLKETYLYYRKLVVIDASGRVIASTDRVSEGEDRSRTNWFTAVRDMKEVYAQDVELSDQSGSQLEIGFLAAIRNDRGEFLGVFRGQIGITELGRAIERSLGSFQQRDQTGSIEWQLLRADGLVIGDSVLHEEGQVNLLTLSVPSAQLSFSKEGGYVEEMHARRHLPIVTGYAKTKGYGEFPVFDWRVLVRIDRNAVVTPVRSTVWIIGSVGFLILGPLLIVLTWTTSRLRKEWGMVHVRGERLNTILTSIGDAVIVTDERGDVSFLNPVAQHLTGWTQKAATGQSLETVFAIVNETTRQTVESPVAKVLRDGITVGLANHTILIGRNGAEYPIDDSGAPIRDGAGRITGVVLVFRDISERKRAETALVLSNLRFRAVIQAAMDGIVVTDASGTVTLWNDAAKRMFGYDETEIVGQPLSRLMPERFHEKHQQAFSRSFERGQLQSRVPLIAIGLRKDGTEFPVECSLAMWQEQDNTFVSGILRDLTDRKRAERRTAGEHAVTRILAAAPSWSDAIQKIPQAIAEALDCDMAVFWRLDFNTNVLRCAAAWHRLSTEVQGFVKSTWPMQLPAGTELPGRVWQIDAPVWIDDIALDCASPRSTSAAQAGLHGAFGFPVRAGDTTVGVLEAFSRQVQESDESLLEMFDAVGGQIGQFLDRKRAEESLDHRVQFERLMTEISSRLIGMTGEDLHNGISSVLEEAGKFLAVERVYICVLAPGRATVETVHEWCAAGAASLGAAWQQSPTETIPRMFHELQQGRTISVHDIEELPSFEEAERAWLHSHEVRSVLLVPIVVEGGLIGFMGFESMEAVRRWHEGDQALLRVLAEMFGNAITRQRTEEALRDSQGQLLQAQKMEAVGRLAGGIAHDFNNLLTVILGCSDLMLPQLGGHVPLTPYLLEIKGAGERAASLTRQLLAFSRKQIFEPRVFDLNQTVALMASMLRRLIGEHIDLIIAPGDELWLVKADPSQIEQVIMNLAINARDAMPDGGTLTIETSNIEFEEGRAGNHDLVQPGAYVMIVISDTGRGIDPAIQARIFEPFFTTKEQGQGTGLGLAMVYGIVKQSNGSIGVFSELERGTAFKIYLPRYLGESETAYRESRPDTKPVRGSETILLVEDDRSIRLLLTVLLEQNGFKVLQADNGLNALQTAAQHAGRIDLLITDIIMPKIGGRVLADRLIAGGLVSKVLYISGYTERDIVHQGVLNEGTPFLPKPFSNDALLRKVREMLDLPPEPAA